MATILDPDHPRAVFAAELRAARETAGLSRQAFARKIGYSTQQLGHVETGERAPTEDFAKACDRVLSTNGAFVRQYDRIKKYERHRAPLRAWIDCERKAHTIRSWQPWAVDGLLQTPDYAWAATRAVLPWESDERIQELVAGRLDRQVILQGSNPPQLHLLMDEVVLLREFGSPQVMADQLTALACAMERPWLTLQVLKLAIGAHPGLNGGFAIADLQGSRSVGYLEHLEAHLTDQPEQVLMYRRAYDALHALALPAPDSRAMILEAAERWSSAR